MEEGWDVCLLWVGHVKDPWTALQSTRKSIYSIERAGSHVFNFYNPSHCHRSGSFIHVLSNKYDDMLFSARILICKTEANSNHK